MSWLFAPIYDAVMSPTEQACLREWRAELLRSSAGDVLEIGAGTGVNIPLYPDTPRSVTFTEPDAGMRKQLEHKLQDAAPPWDHRVIDTPAETLPFDDDSFDTLVSTLVLCTVADPEKTLSELARVARPGATLIFLEHVAAEEGSSRRFWQGFAEPVWKVCAGNCHLTRDTESTIRKHFEVLELQAESMRKAIGLVRPTIRGLARIAPTR